VINCFELATLGNFKFKLFITIILFYLVLDIAMHSSRSNIHDIICIASSPVAEYAKKSLGVTERRPLATSEDFFFTLVMIFCTSPKSQKAPTDLLSYC